MPHHRVVDSVPHIPDKQKSGKHPAVHLKYIHTVPGKHSCHQRKRHTSAGVTQTISDLMLYCQAGGFLLTH